MESGNERFDLATVRPRCSLPAIQKQHHCKKILFYCFKEVTSTLKYLILLFQSSNINVRKFYYFIVSNNSIYAINPILLFKISTIIAQKSYFTV